MRWSLRTPCLGLLAIFLIANSAARADFFSDPAFDTFGAGPILQDITDITAISNGMSTSFTIDFNPIVTSLDPASAFSPHSLVGYVDLDTDKSSLTGGFAPWGVPLTGGNNWINYFIAPNPGLPSLGAPNNTLVALGDEYFVDLYSEGLHPGFVDLIQTSDNTIFATVAIAYNTTQITFDVPVVAFDGSVPTFGMIVGTYAEATDRAPNGANAIPEPCSIVLCGLGLLGLGARGRWRRRIRGA